ncbi:GntT/GntP/DsdX family permease [Streptomyces mirabilis]|uniref:GntT/GntP/DsdX family permease n=1 Tax=Streptomyces mirabilis TaxID=68239 RepID=UPI00365BF8B4
MAAILPVIGGGDAFKQVLQDSGIGAAIASAADGAQLNVIVLMAIGAGSLGLNHVNHAGFRLVKEPFGMNLIKASKTQSVVQTLASVLGLATALLLSASA